jgi:predicted flap endonuclease-1-like 5' DNA nuclease
MRIPAFIRGGLGLLSFSRHAVGAFAFALIVVLSTLGSVSAQSSPPPSLVRAVGDLYAKDTKLVPPPPPAAAKCGTGIAPGPTPVATATWTVDPMPFNGTPMYHIEKPITWQVSIAGVSPTGYTVKAELLGATTAALTDTKTAPAATNPNTAVSATGSFNINTTNFQAHEGKPLQFRATVTPTPGPGAVPGVSPTGDIQCGAGTKLTGVEFVLGMPGDGDIDGDGIPDPQDLDMDGDGASNADEIKAFTKAAGAKGPFNCLTDLTPKPAENPQVVPGKHDSDGDGWTDQEECQKGYNPMSASSAPTKPKTILEILMPFILLLLLLLVIGAIIFVFMKYGRTAAVTVLSTAELFIPPGQKGKYEIQVQNLSKKGEPRTYQLLATGMPEGWDAKLNVDHVTLEPQGGAQNTAKVWLDVEAPTHADPESAVVTVKAVPLNKAGRKDTMKLPGRASTITSINVPPGSKVPVKRGGTIAAAEPKEAPAAPGAAPVPTGAGNNDPDPVITIEGVGETYAAKLTKAGLLTVGDLRKADPALVAKKTGAPPATVASWQQMAELMQLDGIGAQFAEQLVRSGVTSIAQLAAEKPKDLVAKIEKTNAARETPIQGAGIQDKQAKNFVKAAEKWIKDHPAGAPTAAAAPAPVAASAPAAAAPAAPTAKPQLQVGGLKHDPPAFRQGEAVKSTVNVANNGKDKSTIKLSLFVNDGLADVQTVTVKPGKAADVQFKWTAQDKNKLNIRGELVSA